MQFSLLQTHLEFVPGNNQYYAMTSRKQWKFWSGSNSQLTYCNVRRASHCTIPSL